MCFLLRQSTFERLYRNFLGDNNLKIAQSLRGPINDDFQTTNPVPSDCMCIYYIFGVKALFSVLAVASLIIFFAFSKKPLDSEGGNHFPVL